MQWLKEQTERLLHGPIEVPVSEDLGVTVDATKRVTQISLQGINVPLPFQAKEPFVVEKEQGKVTVEDLAFHPMNLRTRWNLHIDKPNVEVSDHQERFIITFEDGTITESYILPKLWQHGEPLARVSLDVMKSPRPFTIDMGEIEAEEVKGVVPKKPDRGAKILHATQILGHVQDASFIQRWTYHRGTLEGKWNFALPATKRTVTTLEGLQSEEGIPVDEVVGNWSYPGGRDFRTGQDYRSDMNRPDVFSSVAGFVAANAQLCLAVAKGEYAIISTNFRAESQLLREVNPHIMTAGLTYTFLTGNPGERAKLHTDLSRFAQMLERVQTSLDAAPARSISLGEDPAHIDDWWKISRQKSRDLDLLLYRTFDFDSRVPAKLNGKTDVVQIPHLSPEITLNHEQGRAYIGEKILGRELRTDEKVIILAGESDDGSFRKRAEEVLAYATLHPEVHIIMPITSEDKRIVNLELPENAHALGFRKDWWNIIPGGDVAFLRGSWGELMDVVSGGIVPIITSPGTVPMDATLEDTQFLTEVSGERACNMSLLIEAMQKRGISTNTINHLLVDFADPSNTYSLQDALSFALQPQVGQQIRNALSSIQTNGVEWTARIHEQLLDKRRPFKDEEVARLHAGIWNTNGKMRRS